MRLIPTESGLFKKLDITLESKKLDITLKILDITLDVSKTPDIRGFLKILDITLDKTKHIARTMPKNT